MKITVYKTRFNENKEIALVKEKSRYFPEIGCVDSQKNCVKMIEELFDASNLCEEHIWLVALNGARKVTGVFEVSRGTSTSSLVHPREIFLRAILVGAVSIILVHNHPSGVLFISEQDYEVTKRVKAVGELVGIPLDDHLIIGDFDYVSAI